MPQSSLCPNVFSLFNSLLICDIKALSKSLVGFDMIQNGWWR
jgi:hypothetical protein